MVFALAGDSTITSFDATKQSPYVSCPLAQVRLGQMLGLAAPELRHGVVEPPGELLGGHVGHPAGDRGEIPLGEPVEVLEAGTGFMMIRRNTFEKFQEAYPQQMYKPDHVRTEHFDGTREIMAFFDTPICEDTKRYLSEDYMFCQWTRKAGMKVWFCPWMQLQHVGMYVFGGSLVDLAQIGAAATADVTQLKKKK